MKNKKIIFIGTIIFLFVGIFLFINRPNDNIENYINQNNLKVAYKTNNDTALVRFEKTEWLTVKYITKISTTETEIVLSHKGNYFSIPNNDVNVKLLQLLGIK